MGWAGTTLAPDLPGILIVDDQMDSGPTLAQMLRRCGHDSVAVTSGPAALSLLAKLTPSVVVLDACVPDVAELDVLRRIRFDRAAPAGHRLQRRCRPEGGIATY